jgi:NADH dehydrogenase/NADH:ubiquinone oxidoreductase subunit G
LAEGNDPGSFEGSDKLLIDEDKNPNRRGARLIGELTGKLESGTALVSALSAGQVTCLLVLQDDILGRLGVQVPEGLVVLATNKSATTKAAHVVLPLCAHVETDGTFINRRSIVQRFREAVWARGEARPGYAAVDALAVAAGGSVVARRGDDIFAALTLRLPDLAGMTWKSLGDQGQSLVVPAPVPGTDAPFSAPAN